jgi:hypothetical protein
MNPYQQNVNLPKRKLGEMQRQADIQRQGNAAQAVQSGAFGGTREGVQRAEFDRGVQDLMQQKIMQDYANNYQQAQAASMQGFEQQQGRQLAGGQALGQAGMQFANLGQGIGALTAQQAGVDISKGQALGALGGQMGNLGTQYGALGEATQQLGAADTGSALRSRWIRASGRTDSIGCDPHKSASRSDGSLPAARLCFGHI